jgi:hypothetical protein
MIYSLQGDNYQIPAGVHFGMRYDSAGMNSYGNKRIPMGIDSGGNSAG